MKQMRILVALAAMALSSAAFAAGEEMKKLDFLLGEFKGEGSMQRGPGKPDVSFVHEKVRAVAGGSVIAIEGRGNLKLADGSQGAVVHDAFGTIWWDPTAKKYRFSAFTADRGQVDAHFTLTGERTAVWGFALPQGEMRYTISMNEKGDWNEIGEYSRDGKQWMKFFEMNLQKVK